MTFSLPARDADGAFGAVIASSSPAVSARCLWLRDQVGAVATQNITDPRLGEKGLDLLAAGIGADDAVSQLEARDPHAPFRQVLAVDAQGLTALRSGSQSLGTVSSAKDNGVVAAGNLLASAQVPAAMVAAFKRCVAGSRSASSARCGQESKPEPRPDRSTPPASPSLPTSDGG